MVWELTAMVLETRSQFQSIWGPWPAPKTPLPESRSSSAQPPVSQTSLPHTTFESSLDSSATSEGSSPEKTSSYVQTSFATSTLAALAQTVPSFSLQAPPSASPSIPTPTSASQLPPFSPPVVTLSSAITVMPIPQNPAGFVAGETSSIHIGSHSHPKAIMSGEGTTSNAGSSVVATTTAKLAPSVTGAGENVKIIWKSLLLLEVVVVVVGLF